MPILRKVVLHVRLCLPAVSEVNYGQMWRDAMLRKDKWRRFAPKVEQKKKNQELLRQLRYTRLFSGG